MQATIVDLSTHTRLIARGKDRRDLVQRLTTNDVLHGGAVANLFTDQNGRVIEPVICALGDDQDIIVADPGAEASLLAWLDQMTFREDATFVAHHGPHWLALGDRVYETLHIQPGESRPGAAALRELGIDMVHIFGEPPALPVLSAIQWHALRVQSGLARADREVARGHNPHEARFADRLNDRKGCYIGQEVVARLETYNKVQRTLVRLLTAQPATIGAAVMHEEKAVGEIAAIADHAALAFVKLAVAAGPFFIEGKAARVLPWPGESDHEPGS